MISSNLYQSLKSFSIRNQLIKSNSILPSVLKSSSSSSCHLIRHYSSINHPHHTKTEVLIPTLNGNIAGLLWTPTSQQLSSDSVEPPIVCMHGHLDNLGSFDPLIPLILKPNRTILAYDFAGHGRTSHTGGGYYDHFLEGLLSIQRILSYFQWKKVTLLGHSLGAQVAYLHAATYPDTVHKYVALDNLRPVASNPGNFHNAIKLLTSIVLKTESVLNSGKERKSFTFEELVQHNFKSRKGTVNIEGCRALVARSSEKVPGTDNLYRFTHDVKLNIPVSFRIFTKAHGEGIANRLKCPICFIKGDPGENYEPLEDLVETVELVRKLNPSPVEYHMIPGSHHFHLNSPELVAPIVNKFLDSSN